MSQSGTFESAHGKDGHMVDANKHLERIRIPKFLGDKKEYQSWWGAKSMFLLVQIITTCCFL